MELARILRSGQWGGKKSGEGGVTGTPCERGGRCCAMAEAEHGEPNYWVSNGDTIGDAAVSVKHGVETKANWSGLRR